MHFGAGRDLVVGIQEFYFKYAWFEIPTKYASGSVQEAVGYVSLELRGESASRDIVGNCHRLEG